MPDDDGQVLAAIGVMNTKLEEVKEDVRALTEVVVYGEDGHPSLVTRVDRLEQERIRRESTSKGRFGIIGGIVSAVIASITALVVTLVGWFARSGG